MFLLMLSQGAYFLTYHSVGWEDSAFTHAIPEFTVPPDVFRRHLKMLSEVGRLTSPQEALQKLRNDTVTEPLIVLWFDDGHKGVIKWALPELQNLQISGALSVCSQFITREEFYWRSKMSYLSHLDLMRAVRSVLREKRMNVPPYLRSWSIRNFDPIIVDAMDTILREQGLNEVINKGKSEFMNVEDVKYISEKSWIISNHTSSHYPTVDKHMGEKQFLECERFLNDIDPFGSNLWVFPFGSCFGSGIEDILSENKSKIKVLVGNKKTKSNDLNNRREIHRIPARAEPASDLKKRLSKL